MPTLSVRLSNSLNKLAKEVDRQDHVFINQFITSTVAEKVAALIPHDPCREPWPRISSILRPNPEGVDVADGCLHERIWLDEPPFRSPHPELA